MNDYRAFLERKSQLTTARGFAPAWIPDFLFDFQRDLVSWACVGGRAAIFADTGLGKTPMQLVWAENVIRKTNKPVLILTPLAVSAQTVREADKFGIRAERSPDGSVAPGINVANYERLNYFNPDDFGGVVCDESSILKNFSGVRRRELTVFMRKVPHRLLCTATAAPNDYTELGTSSEALGNLGHMDMLNRFFKNDQNNSQVRRVYGKRQLWRLKGHADEPFWRWVCSWARAIRRPSDLGDYDDKRFALPSLVEREHGVIARSLPTGMLFNLPATSLQEQRDELRRTVNERCERAAELADNGEPAIVWCHLNVEGDMLERMITDARQVSGSQTDDEKERRLLAFQRGDFRVLVIKPKIGAWGLNLQHCAHVVYFPSHSFEQYYQAVRRCWRFGQTREVVVDVIATEGQARVLANLQQKSVAADRMFERLVHHMRGGMTVVQQEGFDKQAEVPGWLCSIK